MLIIFVLSALFGSNELLVRSALHYRISAVYMSDTQKYVDYTEPLQESIWLELTEDAQNLGLMFAGKSEFSWVVDLRVHRVDQELWSTGNLISSQWVMTTCRAKHYLDEAWRYSDEDTKELTQGIIVSFFQLYFWEFVEFDIPHDFKGDWPYGGSRRVESSLYHPLCDLRRMRFDIALLKLERRIAPASPFIGYMPAARHSMDYNSFANVDFSRLEANRMICFVGSIGRDYVNWPRGLVVDFKTRLRVYHEPIQKCTRLAHRLCNSTRFDCGVSFSGPTDRGRRWECMRARARVGTVCDHDRGAPVVCNDEVVGMVAYGALYQNCNNRIPLPFIVIKLRTLLEWSRSFSFNPLKELWGGNT